MSKCEYRYMCEKATNDRHLCYGKPTNRDEECDLYGHFERMSLSERSFRIQMLKENGYHIHIYDDDEI